MRYFLILSLFFSAAICGSMIPRQSNEFNLKERASLLLRDSKHVGPGQLNRWLEKAVPLDGNIIIFQCSCSCSFVISLHNDPDGGIISSPNYPGSYSDKLFCTYLIDLRTSADTVLLKFLDFETEACCDFVKVYDGSSVNNRLLLSANGSSIPASVTSSTAQMLVTFTTDSNTSGFNGFLATYSNGGPNGCGKTYTDITGNISSINYPQNYTDNLDCLYSIDLRYAGASSVNLTFSDFSLDSSDRVLVYEGLTTAGTLLLNVSGSVIPPPVISRTFQMLVRFTTANGDSGNSRGFFATYFGF